MAGFPRLIQVLFQLAGIRDLGDDPGTAAIDRESGKWPEERPCFLPRILVGCVGGIRCGGRLLTGFDGAASFGFGRRRRGGWVGIATAPVLPPPVGDALRSTVVAVCARSPFLAV